MRNHGNFANTTRFNLAWLLRVVFLRKPETSRDAESWSLAMAFQKNREASIDETGVADQRKAS